MVEDFVQIASLPYLSVKQIYRALIQKKKDAGGGLRAVRQSEPAAATITACDHLRPALLQGYFVASWGDEPVIVVAGPPELQFPTKQRRATKTRSLDGGRVSRESSRPL
jgi:hypothetical protein